MARLLLGGRIFFALAVPFAPSWTSAGKACVLFGGACTIGALIEGSGKGTARFPQRWRRAFLHLGRICLGVFFLVTGAQHFLYTAFVASLIPAWFPGDAVFWTYFTGIALLGGLGLLVRRTAGLAALLAGLMVFSWFWIIHVPRTLET